MNSKIQHEKIAYGPVQSRRLGISLGINVMPPKRKLCSFDCIYCHCGRTLQKTMDARIYASEFPSVKEVLGEADRKLKELNATGINVDVITFSGNGEASLHPDFTDLVCGIKDLRDKYSPRSLVAILSNSTTLDDPVKIRGLTLLDRRYMKLDAGNKEMFDLINRPAQGISFQQIIQGLKEFGNYCAYNIQANIFNGHISNCEKEHINEWIDSLCAIKPASIMIYTICRYTPDTEINGIPNEMLDNIARDVFQRSGIPTIPFYANKG